MGNVLPAECVSGVEEVYGRVYLCVWVWKVSRRSRPVVVGRGTRGWSLGVGRGCLEAGGRWAGKGKGVQEGRIGAIGSGCLCVIGVVGS